MKKIQKIIVAFGTFAVLSLAAVSVLTPSLVYAGGSGSPAQGGTSAQPIGVLSNPLKFDSLEQLVFGLVDVALQVGTVVAALSLIWVGFKYVAARGNPKEIAAAHQALLYTVIGIAVLFGSKVIVEIIKGTITPLAPELFKNI